MNRTRRKSLALIIGFTIFGTVIAESSFATNKRKDELSHSDLMNELMEKRPKSVSRSSVGLNAALPQMDRRGDDFFLKASKSVPRIGRRGDDFFIKASKNVPRVGRRNSEFLKASKVSIPRIGKKNTDPFLIGVKSVPRIGRSGSTDELNSAIQKREDSFLAVNDGGLWGVWPWFRNQDFPGTSKRSSYILSAYNDLPLRDKQVVWSPTDAIAQEVELGPPIYLEEQV